MQVDSIRKRGGSFVSFIESVNDGADTAGYDKTDFVLKININEMSLRILREGPKIPQYLN